MLGGCSLTAKPSIPTPSQTTPSPSARTPSPDSFPILIPTPTQGKDPVSSTVGAIETVLYTHPDGLFSMQMPKGYTVSETPFGATFADPAGEVTMTVNCVNTGYPLTADTFEKLVDNREIRNIYALDSYIKIDQEIQTPAEIIVRKSYVDAGNVKTGISYYYFDLNSVLVVDFWAKESLFSAYEQRFADWYSSVELAASVIKDLPIYSFDPASTQSNGSFSIMVSPYWGMHRIKDDYSIVETFSSPDHQAFIQTLVYDDGNRMTMKIAGEIALSLLRNNYTTEIIITKDEILPDGREKLTWGSLESNYQGIITFITHGTSAQILAVVWDQDPDDYYETVLNEVVASYMLDE